MRPSVIFGVPLSGFYRFLFIFFVAVLKENTLTWNGCKQGFILNSSEFLKFKIFQYFSPMCSQFQGSSLWSVLHFQCTCAWWPANSFVPKSFYLNHQVHGDWWFNLALSDRPKVNLLMLSTASVCWRRLACVLCRAVGLGRRRAHGISGESIDCNGWSTYWLPGTYSVR